MNKRVNLFPIFNKYDDFFLAGQDNMNGRDHFFPIINKCDDFFLTGKKQYKRMR